MTSVKPFKQKTKGLIYMRNMKTYEPHQQKTTTEHQILDLDM